MRLGTAAALVLLALASSLSAGAAHAADAPPARPPVSPDRAQATQRLKGRVTQWMEARKGLVIRCPNCNGRGSIQQIVGSRMISRTCSRCDGGGKILSRDAAQRFLYDLRSPAWRSRDTAREEASAAYKSLKLEDAWKLSPATWRIDRVEFADDSHGVAWVFEGKDTVARPSYWILATDPSTKASAWYLYTETDGAWPAPAAEVPPGSDAEPGAPAAGAGGAAEVPPTALTGEALEIAKRMIRSCEARHQVTSAARDGSMLVLYLATRAKDEEDLAQAIRGDVVRATRAAFLVEPKDEAVKLVFLADWRDEFGDVKQLPRDSYTIQRERFERLKPERLSEEELLAHWDHREARHKGYIPWVGKE